MSWQLACFLVLAVVLIGGFAWYERTRPPSQVVALVAALAALAVAGRIAFPVIPNVVATTDIALFAGYALGAAPGFAVGALAGLVSNFWLGQGPWTPWQMAGWGMVGIFGAGLAFVSQRRLGRMGIAAACGLAGLAFGALLDLYTMVTYGGEQSLDRYLVFSARGLPFNIAHATGNIAIALAAGPAVIRMLVRFRERFEVTWLDRPQGDPPRRVATGPAMLGILLVLIVLVPLGVGVASGAYRGHGRTGNWLAASQNKDGGFAAVRGAKSSASMTGWAVLGLEGAGINPVDVHRSGKTPIRYLRDSADRIKGAGDLERTILALVGAGVSPRDFAGRDLVAKLRNRRGKNGSIQNQVNLTAFGILALTAAGSTDGNRRSATWLRRKQNPNGGWGISANAASESDSTGAALQALAAAGVNGKSVHKGVRYLARAQARSGGFALGYGGQVNTQSTAWAIQGLLAVGKSPKKVKNHGKDPFDYLSARRAKNGRYHYSKASSETPVWVTAQALLAIKHKPFPLSAVPRRPKAVVAPTTQPKNVGLPKQGPPASVDGGQTPNTTGGVPKTQQAVPTPNGGIAAPSGSGSAGAAEGEAQGEIGGTGATGSTGGTGATASVTGVTGAESSSGSGGSGGSSDDPDPALVVAGFLALAGAATWGGWLLYRRRFA